MGVAGTSYPGYRHITVEEVRAEAACIIATHRCWGGLPLLPQQLACNHLLYVAKGFLLVGGAGVTERGYSGSQVIRGVYPAQNHSTKAPWPPTTAELAAATVPSVYSPSGWPQLFKRV